MLHERTSIASSGPIHCKKSNDLARTCVMRMRFKGLLALCSIPALMLVACSSDDANQPAPGSGGGAGAGGDAGLSEGGGALQPFAPPPSDPGPGSIKISASGEV